MVACTWEQNPADHEQSVARSFNFDQLTRTRVNSRVHTGFHPPALGQKLWFRLPFRRLSSSLLALQMPFRTSVTIEGHFQVSFSFLPFSFSEQTFFLDDEFSANSLSHLTLSPIFDERFSLTAFYGPNFFSQL